MPLTSSQVPELPNSLEEIARRRTRDGLPAGRVWAMLLLRPCVALGFQCLFAVGYAIGGSAEPWRAAADWWLGSFALGEVVNLGLLVALTHREGIRYRDLFGVRRAQWKRDVLWVVLALLISGPIGFLPNILLGQLLWGDAQVGADMAFRALPVAGAWAILIGFPVVHALTELPTYLGYVMPRLQVLSGRRAWPAVLCALVLSTQHVLLPLLFDWRFVTWRLLMFLPFALWLAWVVDRRPTTLRYLAIGHYLLDFQLPVFVLLASADR
jgi:hypothetical protein